MHFIKLSIPALFALQLLYLPVKAQDQKEADFKNTCTQILESISKKKLSGLNGLINTSYGVYVLYRIGVPDEYQLLKKRLRRPLQHRVRHLRRRRREQRRELQAPVELGLRDDDGSRRDGDRLRHPVGAIGDRQALGVRPLGKQRAEVLRVGFEGC